MISTPTPIPRGRFGRLLKTSTKAEEEEAFQVGAIVAKLPSSWKGYRKRILHKSEDYSLEEIQKHLRIEEESRSRDKMVEESNGGTNKANAVSKANHPKGKNNNDKRNSGNYMSPKKNQEQFKGKKGPCFVCGKPEHYARECRYRKDLKGAVVNAIDEEIIATLSDVCILSDEMKGIIETKRFLSSTFKMKDLGEVDTILGIKVKRNSGGYALNQTHYIEKVVSKFSHLKIKDANTPFDSSIKLEKNDVSKLSRFISNPSVEHWKAIGRVLGYLKNTKELSLQYSKFPAILEEYIALATTGKEVEWLRDLMMDIPFTANNVSTVSIHCDSQATLARAYSGVYNGKSRHISIRHEVKLKVFNEIQSMCDKHLKGNKDAGRISPMRT
ncbi:hypothetical protein CK203_057560 [Vitis vinifera]|uniref:CCHC-type domain-containing protein n=1 Tax=Vitis vinifera TaxID=29760 RepID=A0A438GGX3_VITVI|nr:hypothetical protein CK203_057560 [Vitis vinifera]